MRKMKRRRIYMKTKKRKKVSRHRGSHTHGRGFKKKARGKGHRGGIGMAGSGKRGDQKKTKILNLHGNDYFGKSKTRRGEIPKKLESINLRDISEKYKGKKEVELKGYKILSEGNLKEKITIKASAASKSAIDKVKKLGGDIILEN
jgi:large subunit ribosomal protein L15